MISGIESPERHPVSVRTRIIAFAFWTLAVMVLVNVHWLHLWGMPMVRPAGYAAILISCLLVLGLVNARLWQAPGTPGALLFAAIASYLVISVVALFVTDAKWQPDMGKDILRQAFFLLVLSGAILGGHALLKRIGIEALLKGVLAILTASCLVIVASPVLRDLGVLPIHRQPFRLTGTFTDPNDAGFIGCMTAVLALAFLCNGGQRKRAYLGLAAGFAAAFVSLSRTASLVFVAMSVLFLVSEGRGRRQPILFYLLVVGLIGGGAHWTPLLREVSGYTPVHYTHFTALRNNPGLSRDYAILLAVRDTLAGDGTLNWSDAVPIGSWEGVRLDRVPTRVVALQLTEKNLSGRIPPELGGLDQLVGLSLNRNRLTGPIPPELGNLTNLGRLALSFNALTGPIPAELGNLLNLRELWLEENELTGTVPTQLKALDKLLVLSLRGNNFSGAVGFNNKVEQTNGGFVDHRLHLWKIGLEKSLESPIIGNGIGQLRNMDGALLSLHRGKLMNVHNLYILLVGEAGIVPLSLYLLFLFSLLRLHWTAPKSLVRDAIVGWAIVMALFSMAFHHLLTMGAFVFLAGLSCALTSAAGVRR